MTKSPISGTSSPRSWQLLVAANIAGGAGQSVAGAASVLLAQRVANTAHAGFPQALLVVGTSKATLVLSRASQRWGRTTALAAGQLVALGGAAAGVLAALTAGLVPLLIGSFFMGAGQAATLLARYAAADLASPALRARAMGRLLTATTVGAVVGPNLLEPSDAIGSKAGLAALTGPYVVAIACFALAALALRYAPARKPQRDAVPDGAAGWSRQNLSGLAVLSTSNLIMIAVMTMAPLHMEHLGSGLTAIGVVVSIHIAGMFLPSSLSGYLTARVGGTRSSAAAGLVLAIACVWAATTNSDLGMAGAMLFLGAGWNLALLAGSTLITDGVPEHLRPRREGFGDTSMGLTAAIGGVASGAVMQTTNYATLAAATAVLALISCAVLLIDRRPAPT